MLVRLLSKCSDTIVTPELQRCVALVAPILNKILFQGVWHTCYSVVTLVLHPSNSCLTQWYHSCCSLLSCRSVIIAWNRYYKFIIKESPVVVLWQCCDIIYDIIVVHIWRHHWGGGGGVSKWWRLMTEGGGGFSQWWRHQKLPNFWTIFRNFQWFLKENPRNFWKFS
jgi:hypothetical protein